MYDQSLIAQTTYQWSDTATARKFKLALRGQAINWLKDIKDTERVDVYLCFRVDLHFKSHSDIQIQTMDKYGIFWNSNA
jgi:hypothetical protein